MIYYRKTLFGSGPKLTAVQSEDEDALTVDEAIKMIKPIKTMNLKQARVTSLRRNVDSAKQQLKLEKDRQHHQQAIKPISSKP